jgi:hypothetical protein
MILMRKTSWRWTVMTTMVVMTVGLASFLFTRAIVPAPVAQGEDMAIDKAESLKKQLIQTVEEDNQKPRFLGELNGIRFVEQTTSLDSGCAPGELVTDATPSQVLASPLNFRAEYLTDGLALAVEHFSQCSGKVIGIGRNYGNKEAPFPESVNIVRTGRRVVRVDAPRDRLETLEIAGKPAVLVKGFAPPNQPQDSNFRHWTLIIAEDFGVTIIEGGYLDLQELMKIAEAVR